MTSRTTIGRLVDRRCTGEDQAVVAAAEFELTARVREWRLKPLGAEAPVPQAIADAFRRSNRAVWHDDDLWKVQARGQMWESL